MIRFVLALLLAFTAAAQIPGTFRVTGPVAPPATNSNFGAALPVYNYGGLLTGLSSLSQLQDTNRYPVARRHAGQVAVLTNGVAYQLGADLSTWVNYVPSVSFPLLSDLLATDPTWYAPGAQFEIKGRSTNGWGGGIFVWEPTSTSSTNRGTIFSYPYGTATGRYKRLMDGTKYDPTWFGAIPNDTLDDYTAIQNMIDTARSTPMIFPVGQFDLSATIVLAGNTALGFGYSGQTMRGSSWHGTSAVTNAASFEHTLLLAQHTNSIIRYSGLGAAITDFDIRFAFWPTTANTTSYCIEFSGGNTVMCEFARLRFYNGYRTIYAVNSGGSQWFSNWMHDIFILGFTDAAFELAQGGTQSIFDNIYITPAAPIGQQPINSETTSTISTLGNDSTFTLTADFAGVFEAGELVSISACDNAALNGSHSITAVTATSITVTFQSAPSPAPTIATISKAGGSATVAGYVIRCAETFESNWRNLNVEWLRTKNGSGILFGDRTYVQGFHLEGIGFGSDVSSTGSWVRSYGPLKVDGWEVYNSYVLTNQTWFVFGPGTTNSYISLDNGHIRDQYYNSGSTLGLCGNISGIAENNLFFGSYSTNGTVRFNRTGYFNGVNYALKYVGADASTGAVVLGAATTGGTALTLRGGATARALVFQRSGVDEIGISPTTDGFLFFNNTDTRGIAQLTGSSTDVSMTFGTLYTATSPNVSLFGPATTTGSDITSGTLTIRAPLGTGNATGGGTINFATPNAGASGATTQSASTKVTISKVGDLVVTTAGQGLQIKEGSNAKMGVSGAMTAGSIVISTTAVTANSRIFLTPQTLGTVARPAALGVTARTAGTSFTITSSDATDTSTVAWLIVEPSP